MGFGWLNQLVTIGKRLGWLVHRRQMPLTVFLIALFVRSLHALVYVDHRLCLLAPSRVFLDTAADLLLSLQHGAVSPGLTDRVAACGAPYIGYLAVLELISGINPVHPAFENRWLFFTLANSFLDALSCMLVFIAARLAFGRRVALV